VACPQAPFALPHCGADCAALADLAGFHARFAVALPPDFHRSFIFSASAASSTIESATEVACPRGALSLPFCFLA
jgi:hypothetical protein